MGAVLLWLFVMTFAYIWWLWLLVMGAALIEIGKKRSKWKREALAKKQAEKEMEVSA